MKHLIERFDLMLNPILMKEVYQGFRSRAFTLWYILALLASIFIFVIYPMSMDNFRQQERLGYFMFYSVFVGLSVLACLIVPFSTGRQLRDEIQSKTLDLISITHLTPSEILWGRFQAGLLKIILLLAFLGPFMTTAFIYGGIGLFEILFRMLILLAIAAVILSLVLYISALVTILGFNLVTRLLLPVLFFFAFVSVMSLYSTRLFSHRSSSSSLFIDWLPLFLGVIFITLICRFFITLGAQYLTPLGNRDYREAKKLFFYMTLYSVSVYLLSHYSVFSLLLGDKTLAMVTSSLGLCSLILVSIFWLGQMYSVPVQMLDKMQQMNFIKKTYEKLFNDGVWGTICWYILVSWILMIPIFYHMGADTFIIWFLLFSYLLFYSGLSRFLWLTFFNRRRQFKMLHYALVLLGVMLFLSFSGMMVTANDFVNSRTPNWLFVLFPVDDNLQRFKSIGLLIPACMGIFFTLLSEKKAHEYTE